MSRTKIIAGNWKMNLSRMQAQILTSEIQQMAKDELSSNNELILIPPFVHLQTVSHLIEKGQGVALGAQNCAAFESGAYTGEVSATMLRDYNCSFVLIGHSERRDYFHENAEVLVAKLAQALAQGLRPIVCFGEPLEVREAATYLNFVEKQLDDTLKGCTSLEGFVLAYEPVWAIGTGKTASAEQAQEVHAHIRNYLKRKFGEKVASETPILYGGSCKPDNAASIFEGQDIDGGLIGGAALKSRDFIDIAKQL
ncbi:MAG: triose-phosphate isomerase [Bernardetiaceae bacterium]|nr:triose-phosphate isomerase [Bernardetiaceae bacterium]